MSTIKIAIVGIGNCASSLVQGIAFYTDRSNTVGLAHPRIGPYSVSDIEVVAAIDIDARKVGHRLDEAIFSPPNNTKVFCRDVTRSEVIVQMGPPLDGVSPHLSEYPEDQRFVVADQPPVDVAKLLRDSGAEILVNYVPVGSQQTAEYHAECCLSAGVSLVNCVPVFIASDHSWAKRFANAGIPCIGDDIKAQVGATITHRTLARLFDERGVRIDSTYQLNTGGNTDFLNMLNRQRLSSKKRSKTEAVQSQLDLPLDESRIHIGPSDYIPFQKDNKVCFLRIEGTGFGGVPMNLEMRLSVEDSPNSAGVAVDAIRCCRLARDAGMSGPIEPASAWTMKRPIRQMSDAEAHLAMEEFISEAMAASVVNTIR
jgi:myo-inositol-1-phosphate synthase